MDFNSARRFKEVWAIVEAAELARIFDEGLEKLYPDAVCSLDYGGDAWRLLVMARLSAQCTDERVNIVCEGLFARFPDARAMADAPIGEIEDLIRSCGLFRAKAASIKEMSRKLIGEYGGEIPRDIDRLLEFPGVGRKIANLVLGDVYGLGGIVADTHFMRICGRLGFYPEDLRDAARVERIMDPLIPRDRQSELCHRAVLFGRDICSARKPECTRCPLAEVCRHGGGA